MPLPGTGEPLSKTAVGNVEAEVFPTSASINEMTMVARRLRRHIISMIGRAGSGHPVGRYQQ